jgi:CobQ-like glutamine amidotransferase family enzyme/UDP-N-acetylmuramyl tripeptide synthase
MHLRDRIARHSVVAVSALSRRLGLGSGSTIGGRVGLLIDPLLLARLGAGKTSVIVSGTNGKTTTTTLLAAALGDRDVATSPEGANMSAGLVGALAKHSQARTAVLEVDEAYLPVAIAQLRPATIVLLNLSRDQLDRVSEVRMLAARWHHALATTTAHIVANADDPLVVYAARECPDVSWFAAGNKWHNDAYHCPVCDSRITYHATDWHCSCGLARPQSAAYLDETTLVTQSGARHPIDLSLPGQFNIANAAMAALGAQSLGVEIDEALAKMAPVATVAGRFSIVEFASRKLRLLLAKNPAGWSELLELVRNEDRPVVIAINARIADGHDPSWLWDVPFEVLAGRRVIATGERRLDLAVRLRHAGITPGIVEDQLDAVRAFDAGEIDYIGNYTAFQDLRSGLTRRKPARSAPTPLAVPPLPRPAPSTQSALSIVVVHPDLLGTYGDGGNARVLCDRARWRGIDAEVIWANSDDVLPAGGDIYLLGGGEDGPQVRSVERLADGVLARAVDRGATVFAVCAGYQIIGNAFPGSDGTRHDGLGLLDVVTERFSGPRSVGEVAARPVQPLFGVQLPLLSGFENHQSHTRLGRDVHPLAQVMRGRGNGDGRNDGAVSGSVLGTYLHGPVLARNPALADAVLRSVVGHALEPLEDDIEQALRSERLDAAGRASGASPAVGPRRRPVVSLR